MISCYWVLKNMLLKVKYIIIPTANEQKPEEVASNTDSGFETNSVTSASSSSQLTKVRYLIGELLN